MAFPTTSILDDFNRANQGPPPSANWTDVRNNCKVVSNQFAGNNASDYNVSLWTANSFGANQEVYAKIGSLVSYAEILVRNESTSNTANGYGLYLSSTTAATIYKYPAATAVANFTFSALAVNDCVGLEVSGGNPTTFNFYIKRGSNAWALSNTANDSSSPHQNGGYIGLDVYGTTQYWDDFGGGNIVAGALEQEGSQWVSDDGNEATANFTGSQDANITFPSNSNLRLRFLLNANNIDPGANQFKLVFKKSNEASYKTVPTNNNQVISNYTANTNWVCPDFVTSVNVQCWAPGGAGAGRTTNGTGGGGGGGAFSGNDVTTVPGNTYTLVVPAGPSGNTGNGAAAANCRFADGATNKCLAEGGKGGTITGNGTGGAGGAIANCVGTTKFAGGAGGAGEGNNVNTWSGGGGGGAGNAANGGNANIQVGGTGGSTGGGNGANGVNSSTGAVGLAGSNYGGGGSGAKRRSITNRNGGKGANAYMTLTYTPQSPILLSLSANIPGGGGTNTTQRMTPPANKTANDFEAIGKISDDTNPLASLNITANKFIEVEFCLIATNYANDGDIYQFRIETV